MSFYDDDLDTFFSDYAVTALFGIAPDQVEIQVIFDESTEKFDSDAGGVISTVPAITCKTSDVLAVKKNDVVIVNSKNWKIITPAKPDGTGITIFGLQEV
jgi:hypothetical protein